MPPAVTQWITRRAKPVEKSVFEQKEATIDPDPSLNNQTKTLQDDVSIVASQFQSEPWGDITELNNHNIYNSVKLEPNSNGYNKAAKSVPYMEKPPENMKCLGINGYWYNIGSFIKKHPGGPVIEEFVGYDATDAYRSFHKSDVLKERHFRPIGYYNKDWFEFNKAMSKLHDDLLEEGFYKVNYNWYALKFSLTFLYISLVFLIVAFYGHSWIALSLAAPLLSFFWQQNGFLMHDLMHTQVSHDRNIDEMLGVWTGTVCIG